MKTLEKILSENLLRLRKAKGFRTQPQLAEAAGIPVRTYQNIEGGIAFPKPQNIEAIARALEIHPSELFIDPEMRLKVTPAEAIEVVSDALKVSQALKLHGDLLRAIAALDDAQLNRLARYASVMHEESHGDLESQDAHLERKRHQKR